MAKLHINISDELKSNIEAQAKPLGFDVNTWVLMVIGQALQATLKSAVKPTPRATTFEQVAKEYIEHALAGAPAWSEETAEAFSAYYYGVAGDIVKDGRFSSMPATKKVAFWPLWLKACGVECVGPGGIKDTLVAAPGYTIQPASGARRADMPALRTCASHEALEMHPEWQYATGDERRALRLAMVEKLGY